MRGHPLVSGIFCTLFLGLALSSLWHKTPTYDELGHLQFGHKVLRGAVTEPDMQRMPVTAFNALVSEAAEAVPVPLPTRRGCARAGCRRSSRRSCSSWPTCAARTYCRSLSVR